MKESAWFNGSIQESHDRRQSLLLCWRWIFKSATVYWLDMWIFTYAFAFQIYFDFSGYTDVARGSAKLLATKVPVNFISLHSKQHRWVWHRWHISLRPGYATIVYSARCSRCSKWLTIATYSDHDIGDYGMVPLCIMCWVLSGSCSYCSKSFRQPKQKLAFSIIFNLS